MGSLSKVHELKLEQLAKTLVDQNSAKIAVPPLKSAPGFWFGAGNMVESPDGGFYLCGRYRNSGDSRTGLQAGARGAELAVFRSRDRGKSFEKVLSFSKADLSYSVKEVLSIERCWLLPTAEGVELYVSTEKTGLPYPKGYEEFQKPGTGVWSIDRISASSIDALDPVDIRPLLTGTDPQYCHLKDPLAYVDERGNTVLMFSTHPFNWSSSNTALAVRRAGEQEFGSIDYTFFPRGFTWDVAVSRICGILQVPRTGIFKTVPTTYLYFYDGAEGMRNMEEHGKAVKRPRGYSCEELGGAAYCTADIFPRIERLSTTLPYFTSPHGTGCSRYTTSLQTEEGVYTTWQQSQPDRSQPLVLCFTSRSQIEGILEA
ncbi:MAG: hypothetical protein JSV89_13130 [Spirochaetaceae bacterium]|nr:MAG: hypothetical protein JSV89_13130 [Spirochaetaceae bacterium]